jgi:hypothetical protein
MKTHLSAFPFFLFALLAGYSCNENRSPKKIDFQDSSRIVDVNIRGSGMDSVKISEIPMRMQQFVNEKKIAGAVTLVARDGQIASFEAVGFQDIEKKIPMHRNTIFPKLG